MSQHTQQYLSLCLTRDNRQKPRIYSLRCSIYKGCCCSRDSDSHSTSFSSTVCHFWEVLLYSKKKANIGFRLVNKLISNVPKRTQEGLKYFAPLLAARRKEREESRYNYETQVCLILRRYNQYSKLINSAQPNLLTWLLDEGKEEEATDLTLRILGLNFAAIHTTSIVCCVCDCVPIFFKKIFEEDFHAWILLFGRFSRIYEASPRRSRRSHSTRRLDKGRYRSDAQNRQLHQRVTKVAPGYTQ